MVEVVAVEDLVDCSATAASRVIDGTRTLCDTCTLDGQRTVASSGLLTCGLLELQAHQQESSSEMAPLPQLTFLNLRRNRERCEFGNDKVWLAIYLV